jgi:hypothetical protein
MTPSPRPGRRVPGGGSDGAAGRGLGGMSMRTFALLTVLCVGGLVLAQKDKDKDKGKDAPKQVKMTLVKIDVKGMTLTLKEGEKGKDVEYKATKDTKFIGPKGGVRKIDDDVLKAGAVLGIVADGKTLKEVHLPTRSSKDKDKDKKEKDKKADK